MYDWSNTVPHDTIPRTNGSTIDSPARHRTRERTEGVSRRFLRTCRLTPAPPKAARRPKASSTAAVRPGFSQNSNKREPSGQVLRNRATNESRPT